MSQNIRLIYILGASFSGSTLLGYIIGCCPEVDNMGELKFFNRAQRMRDFICPCGSNILECPFWKEVYKKNYNIFEVPGILHKFKIVLGVIFNKDFLKKEKAINDDHHLLSDLDEKVKNMHPENIYILDTSKSLWRLIHLLHLKNTDIKVIYIKRDIEGNVASFVKHGFGFLRGLFTYLSVNSLIERFIKKNKINALWIDYKKMCTDPYGSLKKLGSFLNTDYSDYVNKMKNTDYHVQVGNLGTQSQFLKGFQGIRYDDKWKKLLKEYEKKILKLFV